MSVFLASMENGFGGCSPELDTDDEVLQEFMKDDEDLDFLSGALPKLQFRKDFSTATWKDDIGMAEVVEKKGKLWITTGIVRKGKLYCSIEETVYLMEIGALQLRDDFNTSIVLDDVYSKLAGGQFGCCWELFEVYRHLKMLGYIVGRHGVAWSFKAIKSPCKIINSDITEESRKVMEMESAQKDSLTEFFGSLQISNTLHFDVYLPNSRFRKSCPSNPSFSIFLSRGTPPSKTELDALQRQCNGIPLKVCQVEHGRVSFFCFNKVELPILP